MSDEQAPQDAPEVAVAEAPAASPPAPPEQVIKLLDYAPVLGEMRPQGKVMSVPEDEAQRLIDAGQARIASEFDRKIAGIV